MISLICRSPSYLINYLESCKLSCNSCQIIITYMDIHWSFSVSSSLTSLTPGSIPGLYAIFFFRVSDFYHSFNLSPPAIIFFIHTLYNKFYNKFWFYSFPLVSILYGFSCWPYLTYMVSCKLSCKLLIITCVRFVIICDGYLLVITCKCSKKKFPVIDEWWTGLCRNMLLFRYLNNDRFPFV